MTDQPEEILQAFDEAIGRTVTETILSFVKQAERRGYDRGTRAAMQRNNYEQGLADARMAVAGVLVIETGDGGSAAQIAYRKRALDAIDALTTAA